MLDISGKNIELEAEVQSLRDQLASQQGEDKRKLEEESEKARGLEAEVQELKKWKDHDKQSLEVRPRRATILARMSPNNAGMLSATTFPE